MARASFNGQVIAESDDTIVVEGNHYFPRAAIREGVLSDHDLTTHCPWKGHARYHNVTVGERTAEYAAWYYPDPLPAAAEIGDRIAFWRGVTVEA